MTGSVIRIKGLQRFRDRRDGKVYCYHRATGTRIREEFGGPAFFARLKELDGLKAAMAEKDAIPKTFGQLVKAFQNSKRFHEKLKPKSQKDYRLNLAALRGIDKMPLDKIDTPFLARLRDRMGDERGYRAANYTLSVLSTLFRWGKEAGAMTDNPAFRMMKLSRPEDLPEANRPWTEAERAAAMAEAPPHLRLPIALGIHTGLRKGDVIGLLKTAVRQGWLYRETVKRKIDVCQPVNAELAAELARAPTHDAPTLCANSRGRTWTSDGFNASFSKFVKALHAKGGVGPGLTFHGLRHTKGGELAEQGLDKGEIALWLGQKSEAMAAHYSRRADLKRKMEKVVCKLESEKK